MDYAVEIYKQLHDEDAAAPEGKEGGRGMEGRCKRNRKEERREVRKRDKVHIHVRTYGMHPKNLPCMVCFTPDHLRKTEVKRLLNGPRMDAERSVLFYLCTY